MLVKDLLADASWILAERAAFEGKASRQRRASPLFEKAMDDAVALMAVAVAWHSSLHAQGRDVSERCARQAGSVASDWMYWAQPPDTDPRWWAYYQLSGLYTNLVWYVCRQAARDPALGAFLSCSLLVWGAFYSRTGIIPQDPSQTPAAP